SPLYWGLAADADSPRLGDGTRSLIAKLPHFGSKKRQQSTDVAAEAKAWLAEIDQGSATVELGLEALAWAYALPQLADTLPADCWWELLGRLFDLTTATGAAAIQGSVGDPWVWQSQLLAAELPLALAYTLPEINACRELAPASGAAIAAAMDELLDDQGLLKFSNFARLRPLLACWTRSRAMADELKPARWKKPARKQYASLVRQALRVTRRDGSQVFSRQEVDATVQQEFWAAAVHYAGNAKTTRAATEMLTGEASKPRKSRLSERGKSLPSPATHSERSAFGLLRTDWSADSTRLAVGYSGRHIATELTCGRDIIWSGHCQPQIRFQGDVLQPTGDWEEVCWLSDKDVDYLEVDIALGPNVRLERHMLLAREDNFLFWADAILANEPGDIDYRLSLPLRPETSFEPAQETREGFLVGSKRRGLVLPLALPEWRIDPRVGSCESADDGLVLRQSATNARGMFVPMFVDLNRARFDRKMTWRQLTVAENRQNQPPDLAVGYRVQVGREQWLMYRSLTSAVGRSLLSHHLLTQFLVGRFTPQGTVQVLVEIE
ncbi:MAG TPA: hypothetical protein VHY20_01200, partial [Pirellulales bacterium]|nr:hypothetical protein [Pirellulales bacterium]